MLYALYDNSNDSIVRTQHFQEPPLQPNPVKGLRWEEYTPPEPPPYVPTIQDQIWQLEASITPRMAREALLGITDINPLTGKTAAETIVAINDEIAVLRSQL